MCYVCALMYVPCRILLQYGNETTQKSNANYVSTLAENGPAIAGPAGPVPAPMPSGKESWEGQRNVPL